MSTTTDPSSALSTPQFLAIGGHRFVSAGFFVARTPLLPFSELLDWTLGDVSDAPDAAPDRGARMREHLLAVIQRPEVTEALFLASPDLQERIAAWRIDPGSETGMRIGRSLARYFIRMCARPTPFGLFAGCTFGTVGSRTRLRLESRERYRRHTRLDMDYLARLVAALDGDPAVRARLRYRANRSVYEASGRIRYVESRVEQRGRSHHLVAIDPSPYIRAAIDAASTWTAYERIVDAVVALDPELDRADVTTFVHQLIDMQVLVSELELRVTGSDMLAELQAQLDAIPETAETARRLREAGASLAQFDRALFGTPPESYRHFASALAPLPASVELKSLVQVDLLKPAVEMSLGPGVMREISVAADATFRLSRGTKHPGLQRFAKDFRARYEDAEVPLVEALDEEVGVGYQMASSPLAEASPLLARLPLRSIAPDERVPWGAREAVLFERYARSLAAGGAPVELSREDVDRIDIQDHAPLPDSASAMVTLLAASEEAIERGEYRLRITGLGGPSGMRLLGRFSHLSADIERAIEGHLRAEERLRPDAIFAEVVHLPDGRSGNILFRPLLRDHEIAFLARAGVPDERCIPVADLRVRVRGERIVLTSARLGREIVPRITNAHNVDSTRLGIYRFLGALQHQDLSLGTGWDWGPLEGATFLPRVTYGRAVLSPARWQPSRRDVESMSKPVDANEGIEAVRAWREANRVPRWIEMVEGGDNAIVLDLENEFHVEIFRCELRSRRRGDVRECLELDDALCMSGPEGRYVHELVVPFLRVPEADAPSPARSPRLVTRRGSAGTEPESCAARFVPGSEWLFAKLYCGTSDADGILRELVPPLVDELRSTGAAAQWFFIRYSDPDWHLRLRFRGEPSRLTGDVVPALRRHVLPKLEDGGLRRIVLDTYDREVDRYGGPYAIEAVERYFEADSDAVLDVLRLPAGADEADLRWRMTFTGVHRLLEDFGLDLGERLERLAAMRDGLWDEFGGSKSLTIKLGERYREERKSLRALLESATAQPGPLSLAHAVFDRRRAHTADLVAHLRTLERDERLSRPLGDTVMSLVHMHMNRMLKSAARAHELVVYDFLCRMYESALAISRQTNANREARVDAAAGRQVVRE